MDDTQRSFESPYETQRIPRTAASALVACRSQRRSAERSAAGGIRKRVGAVEACHSGEPRSTGGPPGMNCQNGN